jgi:hypothetical protein
VFIPMPPSAMDFVPTADVNRSIPPMIDSRGDA